MKAIPFDYWKYDTNEVYKSIIKPYLLCSSKFEIRCFADEEYAISQALYFGKIKNEKSEFETVIIGDVSKEFIEFILNLPKPIQTDNTYNKMVPFFSIFLDSNFSSEHYGTELYSNQI
ncbi:hypothetical protein [Peptoniphilus asaccharolyticus]